MITNLKKEKVAVVQVAKGVENADDRLAQCFVAIAHCLGKGAAQINGEFTVAIFG